MSARAIVVGVDLEQAGDEAIRASLVRQAEVAELTLHFVFAVDPSNLPDAFGEDEFDRDEDAVARAHTLVEQRVARIASRIGVASAGARAVHATLGKPAALLLDMCTRHEAELLVVGTHGRRGLERMVLGSVAETLVRDAPCDVLVARPTATRSSG